MKNKASLQELTWAQVRDEVYKTNSEFARVIDDLNPNDSYTLYKVSYPYGAEILKNGNLFIPNDAGEIVPLKDHSIPTHIKENLSYNLESNPLSLVLKNSVELFFPLRDRTIPFFGLINKGKLFGAWRILSDGLSQQPKFIWDMTSGARSIFLLPKITEAEKHYKLKKTFELDLDKPRSLIDHWKIFKHIANHREFRQKWSTVLLFFSVKWVKHVNDDAWMKFNYHLVKDVWTTSEFRRNQFVWDLVYSMIQNLKNAKPNAYIADTAKHIMALAVGGLPGMAPAIDNSMAPIKGLQDVYLNVYQLENYVPTIIQPLTFNMKESNSRPVYYSLRFPTPIEFAPKIRNRTSIITELYETKSLLNKYLDEILQGNLNIVGTPEYDSVSKVAFDFFHNNNVNYSGIRHSEDVVKEDKTFTLDLSGGKNIDFPSTCTFLKGCVRISRRSPVGKNM